MKPEMVTKAFSIIPEPSSPDQRPLHLFGGWSLPLEGF